MRYPYLLFDADDTLFDFPRASAQAFAAMCHSQDIPHTQALFQRYFAINQALWSAFDRGEITKEALLLERYVRFCRTLGLRRDPAACNRDYEAALGRCAFPLPHAQQVCQTLSQRGHRLYILTNAVAAVQRSRLQGSVFSELILDTFISEDAGAAKPSSAYFAYALARIPGVTLSNALVIGDSLATDIQGANNANLPCCWYNPALTPRPADLRIDYEIHDLRQLLTIV